MSFLNKVTVEDLDVKGRRVLVRVDFNVPLKDGKVTNDNRIVGAIPTIRYLADHGAKVILCSHLGKPKGPDAAFTMAPVAARLGELMGRPVLFADDDTVVGENARRMVSEMKDGDILVLQNTSVPRRPRICPNSARSWLRWRMYMWMTPLAAPTVPTAPPSV